MLQKRLDYGFNGYQVPFIPRAARSARRRGPVRKKVKDNQMRAFDLLATVAGKLLLEGESTEGTCSGKDQGVNAEDVVIKEHYGEDNQLKLEHCDIESAEVPLLSLELGSQGKTGHCNVKEAVGSQHDIYSALGSVISSPDCLEKDDSLDKIHSHDERSGLCSVSGEQERGPAVHMESCLPDANEFVEQRDGEGEVFSGARSDLHSPEDPKFVDKKPLSLVSSDRSLKVSFGEDQHPNVCGSLFPSGGNNVKVVSRDNDEKFSERTQPSTIKTTKSRTRIGDRRIRKLLASKHWRIAPKVKDGDLSGTEFRCVYRSRKSGYKRQRSQRIYPFKKRKFFQYSTLSNSDGDIGCKGVYVTPEKANDMTASGFGAVRHGVNGSSCCVPGQSTNFPSRESHVKLRIKSFRVPELFVEMPETATIGSLKRTIMDAVSTLIGGGLRIGVLFQGKNIRDDNRTLLQSGICHEDKVESLGFTLEPNPSHANLPVCSEDNSLVLSTDTTEHVYRCPVPSALHQGTSYVSSDYPVTNLLNLIESDHDSAPSPADISSEKCTVDSQALVAFSKETSQALAVVPVGQKSKRSEIGQRRIRRPFSVGEVEALVQAVEKLGTGRWRDVKLQAFDNANHRTYVDLKDKWKTLVHTARISPQQRRGQPVPQELLDRVLAAHAYWSQQQAKQQLKQQSEVCHFL